MIELLIVCFSFWFAELSLIPSNFALWLMDKSILYKEYDGNKINRVVFNRYSELYKIPVRLYPFDCTKCLSFWLGGIYSYSMYENLTFAVLMAGVSSLVGMIISKLYARL